MAIKYPPLQTNDFGFFKQTRGDVRGRRNAEQLVPGFYNIPDAVGGTKDIVLVCPFINKVGVLCWLYDDSTKMYYYDIEADTLNYAGDPGFAFDVTIGDGSGIILNGDHVLNGTITEDYIKDVTAGDSFSLRSLLIDRLGENENITVSVVDTSNILSATVLDMLVPPNTSIGTTVGFPSPITFNAKDPGTYTLAFIATGDSGFAITRQFRFRYAGASSGSGGGSASGSGSGGGGTTFDIADSSGASLTIVGLVLTSPGNWTATSANFTGININGFGSGHTILANSSVVIVETGSGNYQITFDGGTAEGSVPIISGQLFFSIAGALANGAQTVNVFDTDPDSGDESEVVVNL